jgi:hypothetical protein
MAALGFDLIDKMLRYHDGSTLTKVMISGQPSNHFAFFLKITVLHL